MPEQQSCQQVERELPPYICPQCGGRLHEKRGRFGIFIGCENYPRCQFTRSRWTVKNWREPCQKCNDTGLIPLVKNGHIIPYAWVDCGKQPEPEHYQPLTLADFDFPMSWDWHRHYCREYGWPDPGPCEPPEPLIEPTMDVITHQEPTIQLAKHPEPKSPKPSSRLKVIEL